MPDKKVLLLQKLLVQTKMGRVKWERTVDDGVFQAGFPGYSIKMRKVFDEETYLIIINIYNDEGSVVERITDNDVLTLGWSNAISAIAELYETARRQAMGVENALDSLIASLEDPPTGEEPPTDEDIPF